MGFFTKLYDKTKSYKINFAIILIASIFVILFFNEKQYNSLLVENFSLKEHVTKNNVENTLIKLRMKNYMDSIRVRTMYAIMCSQGELIYKLKKDNMTLNQINIISKKIINEIIDDMSDRSEFGNMWDEVESETQEEIKKDWEKIIKKNIPVRIEKRNNEN